MGGKVRLSLLRKRCIRDQFSVQFNSDICTRQLMNITLACTAKNATIIKYIHERKTKKLINCENVGFQFCSVGVERKSRITQVYQERVPHSRRGIVEPT